MCARRLAATLRQVCLTNLRHEDLRRGTHPRSTTTSPGEWQVRGVPRWMPSRRGPPHQWPSIWRVLALLLPVNWIDLLA